MSDRDDRIRERAYQLWERAGRPHHRDHDFWHQANDEIAAEDSRADAAASNDTPTAAPAPADPRDAVGPEKKSGRKVSAKPASAPLAPKPAKAEKPARAAKPANPEKPAATKPRKD